MIDPPKRTGYRLTYDAECLYNDWQEIGGCTCFLGCAPCSSCCSDGNPISLEENDEAWELDEEEDMSRSEITDKGGTKAYGKCIRNDDYENGGLTVGKIYELRGSGSNVGFTGDDGTSWGCDRSRFVYATAPTETKSEWFGFKYRVTPESSRLLQEAVFKDGGEWLSGTTEVKELKATVLFVKQDGKICIATFDMPEKQPPQPTSKEAEPKEFKVGKYYKYTSRDFSVFKAGKYYKLFKVSGGLLFSEDMYNYVHRELFDINSESDCDPNAKISVAKEIKGSKLTTYRAEDVTVSIGGVNLEETRKWPEITSSYAAQLATLESHIHLGNKSGNIATTTVGDTNMSTNTQRKVVEVQLFDDAKGLPVQDSLVAKFDNVLTEDDNATTIREVIMNNDIKKVLAAHNVKRSKVINQDILERTGNSVPLQPILLKDLRWKVIG